MRAHPEPIGHYAPLPRSPLPQPAPPPAVLFVVPEGDRKLYAGDHMTRSYAHGTAEALRLIATSRPRLVILDWDDAGLGQREIAAAAMPGTGVLVLTGAVENVPAILKAGCHGVLLKPFAPSILAGRIGRVLKETERAGAHRAGTPASGTNRLWKDVPCPNCGTHGVTSFDFSSYRRMWYACLSCDTTWLGPRKE